MSGAERARVESFGALEDGLREASPWYLWGPYLSERQWGTVREDYSEGGDAWSYFPHDHARSRAYRWGEDGMAGFSDVEQRLCLALALWNGRDPILKERMFGLTGAQANHGEDAKEYWWYLDARAQPRLEPLALPLPPGGLPVRGPHRGERPPEPRRTGVRAPRHRRVRRGPLLDRGGRLRQGRPPRPPHDGAGDERRSRSPTRCTCCRPPGSGTRGPGTWTRRSRSWPPRPTARSRSAIPSSAICSSRPAPGPTAARPSCSSVRTRRTSLACTAAPGPAFPKDGINDRVVHGADSVDPARRGTKVACWYRVEVAPGATVELRLRLRPAAAGPVEAADLGDGFDAVVQLRRREADEFYRRAGARPTPPPTPRW